MGFQELSSPSKSAGDCRGDTVVFSKGCLVQSLKFKRGGVVKKSLPGDSIRNFLIDPQSLEVTKNHFKGSSHFGRI